MTPPAPISSYWPEVVEDLAQSDPEAARIHKKIVKLARGDAILSRCPAGTCHVVEVGVKDGKLSAYLLRNNPDLWLTAIDWWKPAAPDSAYAKTGDPAALASQRRFDRWREKFDQRTARYSRRLTVIQQDSAKASDALLPESVDVVFIDAGHDFGSVIVDIAMFISKVKRGGWIGGHDYDDRFEVKQAVDYWVGSDPGRELVLDKGLTWWVRKA